MHSRQIPFVHPRVIELSREPRVVAIALGSGCGPVAAQSSSGCGAWSHPGAPPESAHDRGHSGLFASDQESGAGFGAEWFGVKRPLRFLAFKLELSEPQVASLAAILDDLKTERAQAAVDDRRALAAFAEAMAGEAFDAKKAAESATLRSKSAERLGDAVVKALGRIHALLTTGQRERFAYLVRTGTVRL